MNDSDQASGSNQFPATQWTLIIEVIQKGGDDASLAALGELFERYRPAVKNFFQRFNRERADDLTQAFFASRIVLPWNRRHGFLALSYSGEDIRRLPLLVSALKARTNATIEYLWNALSDPTRQLAENYAGTKEQAETLRASLVTDLNRLIDGPSIYEQNRFSQVKLSVESRNLLHRQLEGNWVKWLNRSLLGDAFPGILAKGIGFLYLVERQEQRKFRTFLAHAMWWFLKDETKERETQKEGGGLAVFSLEKLNESGFEARSLVDERFGKEVDVEFAVQILNLAASRFNHSKQLEAHLRGEITQKQAAEELGMSENAFRQAYSRFRARLAEAYRLEVTKVAGPDEKEIREEMLYLMSLLAK
jgi:DNA-directed RNA polymerase specialized sigma24 family protein